MRFWSSGGLLTSEGRLSVSLTKKNQPLQTGLSRHHYHHLLLVGGSSSETVSLREWCVLGNEKKRFLYMVYGSRSIQFPQKVCYLCCDCIIAGEYAGSGMEL